MQAGESGFYAWLKERSEQAWASRKPRSLRDFREAGFIGKEWQAKTRWKPFSTAEVQAAETESGLPFPEGYREFLLSLGATDRAMVCADYRNGPELGLSEAPGFYDWREDQESFRQAVEWPLQGLLFDVEENHLWPRSWGVRPSSKEAREARLTELVRGAPPLIPLYGHRYLLAGPAKSRNPVLSVHQADIIVYGSDLQRFLQIELHDILGLDLEEVRQESMESMDDASLRAIPFWGELILDES